MSAENVEIARRALDAWNAGEMEALRDLYDPDAVFLGASNWVDRGPYVGRDAIMDQFNVFREFWGDSSFDVLELRDAGGAVVVRVGFSGDTRGVPVEAQFVWVYTMRGGRIVRLEYFETNAEALAAAGLNG